MRHVIALLCLSLATLTSLAVTAQPPAVSNPLVGRWGAWGPYEADRRFDNGASGKPPHELVFRADCSVVSEQSASSAPTEVSQAYEITPNAQTSLLRWFVSIKGHPPLRLDGEVSWMGMNAAMLTLAKPPGWQGMDKPMQGITGEQYYLLKRLNEQGQPIVKERIFDPIKQMLIGTWRVVRDSRGMAKGQTSSEKWVIDEWGMTKPPAGLRVGQDSITYRIRTDGQRRWFDMYKHGDMLPLRLGEFTLNGINGLTITLYDEFNHVPWAPIPVHPEELQGDERALWDTLHPAPVVVVMERDPGSPAGVNPWSAPMPGTIKVGNCGPGRMQGKQVQPVSTQEQAALALVARQLAAYNSKNLKALSALYDDKYTALVYARLKRAGHFNADNLNLLADFNGFDRAEVLTWYADDFKTSPHVTLKVLSRLFYVDHHEHAHVIEIRELDAQTRERPGAHELEEIDYEIREGKLVRGTHYQR